ncbi:c-type cytochrome [Paenibacillus aceris]|uniref:Mono/diheme cytochrome c family protein n=1 Tax=Paenibacillus aceris TaxID=869555 RepID=A0ABS4I7P6_9BACL|nr:cytochrome c [Paenibacillus aceris]MBP1966933.1 mono/diheme cytochrome c family protein [Paenibacillus aceris]NHW39297.1 cytochrome c [Paenibacillus aceris]
MKKTLLVLTLLLAGSLAACGKSQTTPQTSTNPSASTSPAATQSSGGATKADAQTVFKANCVSCHGVNLEGAVGPNLQKVGSKLSKDQVSTTITNGKGAMPSFKGKLSDDEVSSLATWLADKK